MAFESLSDKLASVFKKLRGKGKLTEQDIKDAMREVRMALLEADVNYKVAKDFIAGVTQRAMGQEVMESLTPAQQVIKIVNDELTELMGGSEAARIHIKSKPPTVIMTEKPSPEKLASAVEMPEGARMQPTIQAVIRMCR